MGWFDQKMGLILGSSLNLRNNPKLNPVLGVGPDPRVNDWVQSGSGWPPGSEIYQIIQFQAVLAKFNQLQLAINHSQLCKKLILHSENLKRLFFFKSYREFTSNCLLNILVLS